MSSQSGVSRMLRAAWMMCSPVDKPLRDQLNSQEVSFLILFADYIESALTSPLASSDTSTVLGDILMTAGHRFSQLSKDTTLTAGHVAILTLLHLLKNLFSADNMKYQTLDLFLKAYPLFRDRDNAEQLKLFHTANWMNILFKIIPAKKNKGMVLIVIPKLVEGNGVHYVTGSGQTKATKDRVTIYETEGNVTPVKRVLRKPIDEDETVVQSREHIRKSIKKKATYVKKNSLKDEVVVRVKKCKKTQPSSFPPLHKLRQEEFDNDNLSSSDYAEHVQLEGDEVLSPCRSDSSVTGPYLPLLPFSMAPPIPIRRTQSSFSEAAALIASQNNQSSATDAPASYLKSPRECYLEVEPNGAMRKVTSANWGSLSNCSPRGESVTLPTADDQLRMLREVSDDNDFSGMDDINKAPNSQEDAIPKFHLSNFLPPYLLHQASQSSLSLDVLATSTGNSFSSPNSQPRALDRCNSASLDEQGEVDLDLLESLMRQGSGGSDQLWLSRTNSASSITEGRTSSLSVNG